MQQALPLEVSALGNEPLVTCSKCWKLPAKWPQFYLWGVGVGQSSFRFVFRIFCGVVVALGGITQHLLGLWLANLLGIGAQVLVTRGVCWRMFPSITMSPD